MYWDQEGDMVSDSSSSSFPSGKLCAHQIESNELAKRLSSAPLSRSVSDIPSYKQMKNDNAIFDKHIKMLVVGDSHIGKTSFINTYVEKVFTTDCNNLNQFDQYYNYIVKSSDDKIIELAIWDLPVGPGKGIIRPMTYSDADVALICYAVDNPKSFQNIIKIWIKEVRHFCFDIPVILVGLKSDLYHKNKIHLKKKPLVRANEAKRLANIIHAKDNIQCSSKDMKNIEKVMNCAINTIIDFTPIDISTPLTTSPSKLKFSSSSILSSSNDLERNNLLMSPKKFTNENKIESNSNLKKNIVSSKKNSPINNTKHRSSLIEVPSNLSTYDDSLYLSARSTPIKKNNNDLGHTRSRSTLSNVKGQNMELQFNLIKNENNNDMITKPLNLSVSNKSKMKYKDKKNYKSSNLPTPPPNIKSNNKNSKSCIIF